MDSDSTTSQPEPVLPVIVNDELPIQIPQVLSPASVFTPQTITIASFLIAILGVAILVILTQRKLKSRGNSLLLVGPPDAGKTAILSTLLYNQTLHTHSSLQVNSSIVQLPEFKTPLRIIDIPGHPRIRDQFREYLPDAKVVAFVVDTNTISRNAAAVAEHLHNVLNALTSLAPSQVPPTLLIVAHKSDILKTTAGATSHELAINRVKTVLERELEKRRISQTGGMGVEGLGEEGGGSGMGGLDCSGTGGTFRFAEWDGGEVSFVGSSVKGSMIGDAEKSADRNNGLLDLQEWIKETI